MGVRWRSSKPPLAMFPSRDPSLSHQCTSVKFLWDPQRPPPALTARFLISRSLTSGVSPTDQSWKPTGLSGHHQRGGPGRDLRHHRALRPVQVRYPHPEDRQQLQSLHVRCFTPSASHIWQSGADKVWEMYGSINTFDISGQYLQCSSQFIFSEWKIIKQH